MPDTANTNRFRFPHLPDALFGVSEYHDRYQRRDAYNDYEEAVGYGDASRIDLAIAVDTF